MNKNNSPQDSSIACNILANEDSERNSSPSSLTHPVAHSPPRHDLTNPVLDAVSRIDGHQRVELMDIEERRLK